MSGSKGFCPSKLPFLRDLDVPVIVNIFGNTIEEYAELAARLDGAPGIAALEINVSCPNVKEGGMVFGTDPAMTSRVVEAVRRATSPSGNHQAHAQRDEHLGDRQSRRRGRKRYYLLHKHRGGHGRGCFLQKAAAGQYFRGAFRACRKAGRSSVRLRGLRARSSAR